MIRYSDVSYIVYCILYVSLTIQRRDDLFGVSERLDLIEKMSEESKKKKKKSKKKGTESLKLDWNECPLFMPRTYSQTVDFVGTFEEKNVTTYAF